MDNNISIQNLIELPDRYVVIDLETTGLDSNVDDIIEVAAVVVDGEEKRIFESLVNPGYPIDGLITEITGITNEMLADAPDLSEVLPALLDIIGDDVIVGHNVSFDIGFIVKASERLGINPLTNGYVDTLRLSRKLLPEISHRLGALVDYFAINQDTAHRACADCLSTDAVYHKLKDLALERYGSVEALREAFAPKRDYKSKDLTRITSTVDSVDKSNPLFGKRVVFTGTLSKMSRADAAQIVVNLGGIAENGITKKTNYLVVSAAEYADQKSSKIKKAESYKLSGCDIDIISESVFYDLLREGGYNLE